MTPGPEFIEDDHVEEIKQPGLTGVAIAEEPNKITMDAQGIPYSMGNRQYRRKMAALIKSRKCDVKKRNGGRI